MQPPTRPDRSRAAAGTDTPWAGLEAALEALGRVAILLDGGFRMVRATATLDTMVCDGASQTAPGRHADELVGDGFFRDDEELRTSLAAGERHEGRRAFLQCREGHARLVSLSIVRLEARQQRVFATDAVYLMVIRPAEEDMRVLDSAAGGMGIVSRSASMLAVVRLIEQLHRSDATVLVTGETGTGKEVVARALHAWSRRRDEPFVGVNCGALPADLLESELFGHIRGAFTGASRDRVGRIEIARAGTLFLDEIGDMPYALQVKLLRLLQERRYERVGESVSREMHARVVAATNVDLEEAVRAGRFREDLYYRLRVVPIHLPPLRERTDDVEPLARHLLGRIGARNGRALLISPGFLARLRRHNWPGNVRELENALEYAVAMCQGQTLSVDHLPALGPQTVASPGLTRPNGPTEATAPTAPTAPTGPTAPTAPTGPTELNELIGPTGPRQAEPAPPPASPALATAPVSAPSGPLDALEHERVAAALEAHHWRRDAAATALGISRITLWRRMKRFGLL